MEGILLVQAFQIMTVFISWLYILSINQSHNEECCQWGPFGFLHYGWCPWNWDLLVTITTKTISRTITLKMMPINTDVKKEHFFKKHNKRNKGKKHSSLMTCKNIFQTEALEGVVLWFTSGALWLKYALNPFSLKLMLKKNDWHPLPYPKKLSNMLFTSGVISNELR